MATVITDNKHYSDIAAAIRSKNGTETKYQPSEMPAAISAMETETTIRSLVERTINTLILPKDTTKLAYNCLAGCEELETLEIPAGLTYVDTNALRNAKKLPRLDFASLGYIGSQAFYNCKKLTVMIIRTASVCGLGDASAFSNMPIAQGTGYVYVPDELVDSYKAATNWVTFADQIKPISELEAAE